MARGYTTEGVGLHTAVATLAAVTVPMGMVWCTRGQKGSREQGGRRGSGGGSGRSRRRRRSELRSGSSTGERGEEGLGEVAAAGEPGGRRTEMHPVAAEPCGAQ
jgi:hypothetical protein